MADLPPDLDILDEIGALEEKLAEIRAKRLRDENSAGAGAKYLASMTAAAQRGYVDGVPHCLKEIGRVLSEPCFEAGNLYGLLSSSGEGKTSLTLQIIAHALEQGHPVQFLSYDQNAVQCVRQMVAQKHGITARQQRDAALSDKEWEMVNDFGNWIDRQPFEVVKCTNQNAAQLKGFARTFIRRHGNGKPPLIVVDHIRRVTPEDRRADHGTQATQKNAVFKSAAEELQAAWLILNQRSTSGMHRDNPRPIAQDLFGGEGAVQDYDAILYLYRFKKFYDARKDTASGPAWKKINEIFPEAVRTGEEDIAELGTIKSRFGNPNLKERVEFEAYLTRYRSLKSRTTEELPL
jgi:replicative DNA helicase